MTVDHGGWDDALRRIAASATGSDDPEVILAAWGIADLSPLAQVRALGIATALERVSLAQGERVQRLLDEQLAEGATRDDLASEEVETGIFVGDLLTALAAVVGHHGPYRALPMLFEATGTPLPEFLAQKYAVGSPRPGEAS